MPELWKNILDSGFIPHGHCYLWKPELVWLHIISDSLIALAYYSIPITLVYFVRKRQDLPFNRIFLLFGIFIVACGTTHVMEIWTLWHPTYWLSGLLKAITALVSVYTALELVPLVPLALALPSPAQLEAANNELQQQITQRQLAEATLQKANNELETRVRNRTRELVLANEELRAEITERQRAEESLQEQEERFRATFNSAAVGIAHVNLEGKWLLVNQKLCDIVGYTHEELLERTFQDITHLDDLDADLEYVQQMLAALIQTYSMEKRYIRKDSSPVWINLTVSLVREPTGEPKYFISVIENISERKRAEAALLESEERFRQMAENIHQVFWMNTPELTEILYVSPAYEQIWGRTCESLYSNPKSWLDDIHPQDRSGAIAAWEKLAQTEYDIEYRLVQSDGSIRWIWDRGFPVRNQAGEIYRVAGIAQDITERKLCEQKISEQAALLNITTDAILVHSLDNQILLWNSGAERMYGWQALEALGKNSTELLYNETSKQLAQAQKTTAQTGSWQGELQQVTKDGREIIVLSRWTLVRDQQQQPKSILTVNTDITEKKQLEARFLRAQRLESIGTLAGGIAHDLNNLLAPILMTAQLLEVQIRDQPSQRLLPILVTNAKRGASLVKQVLSFSRGIEGERTILQVGHLILEIRQIAKATFPKNIELYTDISPNLWTVSGDATQLHQVLMNLVVNARDAMPNGGTLSIEAENQFIDENYAWIIFEATVGFYIVITVADTGTGIPPEIMNKIFEPFFTTKEPGIGTGLGLSTVISIIKSQGGFINVYSEVGQGTQFKVYLPASEGTQTQQAEDIELVRGNGESILVVDDEAAICEITKATLETYLYKVLTASNGIEAIALYARHKNEITAVVIDMMMPEMDGPTTIRTLQKINPQIKIIATSGLASSDKVQFAVGTGVKAFLSKPYTAQDLLKTLHEVLSACIAVHNTEPRIQK